MRLASCASRLAFSASRLASSASHLAALRLAPSRLASAAAERVVEVLQEVERRGEREEEIGELKDAFRPGAAASQHC